MPETVHTKEGILRDGITTDPSLSSMEKGTSITVDNDREYCRFHSSIPVHIRWVISIEDSRIIDYQANGENGEITAVTADIPKGVIKLQGSNRKGQTNGDMVSYGPIELDS